MVRFSSIIAVQIILFMDYKYCLSKSDTSVSQPNHNNINQIILTTPPPNSIDRHFKILKLIKKKHRFITKKLPKLYKKIIYKSNFLRKPSVKPVKCIPIDVLRGLHDDYDFDDYEYDNPYLLFKRKDLRIRKKRDYHEKFLKLSNLFRHIAKASEYEPPAHFEDHELIAVPPRIRGLAGPFIAKNTTKPKERIIPVTEIIENDYIPEFKLNKNKTYFGVSNSGITTPGVTFFNPIKEVKNVTKSRYVIAYGKDYVNQMMRANFTVAKPILPEISGIYSQEWSPENHHIKRNFRPNFSKQRHLYKNVYRS